MIANRLASGLLSVVLLAAATCQLGCRPPSRPLDPDQPLRDVRSDVRMTSSSGLSAEQYLQAVMSRYLAAASYRDSGQVRLWDNSGDKTQSQLAPLSLWYDHSSLYIEAYDARIWSHGSAVTAWFDDPSSRDFDAQVLRRMPMQGRPKLESLFSDPILRDGIGAGLAGPPPTLEWLFAAEPMKHLFHAHNRFQFGAPQSVDGRPCKTVRIEAAAVGDGTEEYVFYIDAQQGLIRQIDLPSLAIPTEPGKPAKVMKLRIELVGATFDPPTVSPPVAALPQRPQFVRRFVPLPPPRPPALLGSRPKRFEFGDRSRRLTISDRGSDREITVLVHFVGDPTSYATLVAIGRWDGILPETLRHRVRTAVLVADEAHDLVPAGITLPIVVDARNQAATSLGLAHGGLTIQDATGRLVWIEQNVTESSLITLGAIIADVLQGVDVPGRVRDQWQADHAAYRSIIDQESRIQESAGDK